MSFLTLTGVRKTFGTHTVVQRLQSLGRARRIRHLPRPERLRQDDDACAWSPASRRRRAGEIRIGGQDVTHLRANKRAIGMVFQSYALFPNMTVAANIGFGLKVARKSPAEHQVAGRRDAGADQAAAARRTLPLSVVGRPAAARLARPRAGAEPADPAARRAALRPRRAHPRLAARGNPLAAARVSASPRSSSPTTRRKPCRCRTASS